MDRHPRPGHRHLPAVEADAAVPRARVSSRRSTRPRTSTSSTRASRRPGSHKPNTAVAQAYYNKEAGIRRLATETGAGQWGSAMAMAVQLLRPRVPVFMVKASYEQKPYRRIFMETFGANVLPLARRHETQAGRAILDASIPDSTGSLGIAISEAVEVAATHDDTNYSLGSVLNHVLLHQTVIGLEAQKQMEMAGEEPDVDRSAASAAGRTTRAGLPVHGGEARGQRRTAVRGRPSRPRVRRSRKGSSPTTSATPAR